VPFVVPQAGITPAVFFVPVNFTVTGEPLGMLSDPIDISTGEMLSIERGFDPTDAAVFLAMRTVRGSGSAVEDVGQRFGDAKLVTPQLETFFREEVRLAFEHLVTGKQIRIEEVTVVTEDTATEVRTVYFNVARDAERTVALPLNQLLGKAA